jgi:very-short-patch-repair endonuclease
VRAEDLDQLRYSIERLESSVQCIFAKAPDELPMWVEQLAERASQPFTVVSIRSAPGAGLAAHLDQAVQVLAEAVLVRYPQLGCGAGVQVHEACRGLPIRGIDGQTRERRRVPAAFWRRTLEACRLGNPPRAKDHALSVEAECLASCLDPQRLVLVWVVPDPSPPETELLGLARAAEWLAVSTHASVLVALSAQCRGRPALDSISYAALSCGADIEGATRSTAAVDAEPIDASCVDAASVGSLPGAARVDTATSTLDDSPPQIADGRPRVTALWPVIGQPHPLSPAEQLFAKFLAADVELSGIFSWNQVVLTREQTRPIVDLVWSAGRLAVEIDGFAHHSSQLAFEQDRQRDWELLVSGYRVLRLPASEVLNHPARCLEKLRTLKRCIAGEI